MSHTPGKTDTALLANQPFDQSVWREQILARLTPFTRNPLHELRLSGTDSALSFLLFATIQPFCTAFEHEPITAVLALAELSRRPGANYLVHNARRFHYQGAVLVERELRHYPELRAVFDELTIELRTLQIVLQRLSTPRIDWLRRAIMQDLMPYTSPHEFQHLRRQLSDPEWQSRFIELQQLRERAGNFTSAELVLLHDCLQDGSSHVRAAAARLAGQAQVQLTEQLVQRLLRVSIYDDDLETRCAAARTVGIKREQIATPPILNNLGRLLTDEDSFVRSATAMVLGHLGDIVISPSVHDALASQLSDPDAYVREAAARALGRIGAPAAVARVLSRLARAVEDSDANVHDAALEALGRLRALRGTQPLGRSVTDPVAA